MPMYDFDKPLYRRKDPSDLSIDIHKIYHIAFFNGAKLDTRPIKITAIFTVGEKNIRTEVNWEYYFEVEKTVSEKLLDKRLWKRLIGIDNEVIQKTITQGYSIRSQDDEDMFDFDLIGETPEIAKMKLCMIANITPHPTSVKVEVINNAIEEFKDTAPDLMIKAMDWKFSDQFGDITNYGKHFLHLKDDIRNR